MKSAREIEIMRRSGKITSSVLSMLMRTAKAGMTLGDLDRLAEKGIREQGGIPTFKGYQGFPASICASLNEVVVHGIPRNQVLKDGDILSIDIGTTFERYVSDTAATIAIGTPSPEAARLLRVTQECLMIGIRQMASSARSSVTVWARRCTRNRRSRIGAKPVAASSSSRGSCSRSSR
jgi:methionyl aminopeptidase